MLESFTATSVIIIEVIHRWALFMFYIYVLGIKHQAHRHSVLSNESCEGRLSTSVVAVHIYCARND